MMKNKIDSWTPRSETEALEVEIAVRRQIETLEWQSRPAARVSPATRADLQERALTLRLFLERIES